MVHSIAHFLCISFSCSCSNEPGPDRRAGWSHVWGWVSSCHFQLLVLPIALFKEHLFVHSQKCRHNESLGATIKICFLDNATHQDYCMQIIIEAAKPVLDMMSFFQLGGRKTSSMLEVDDEGGRMFLRVLIHLTMHDYPPLVSGSLQLLFKHFSQRQEVLHTFKQVTLCDMWLLPASKSSTSASFQSCLTILPWWNWPLGCAYLCVPCCFTLFRPSCEGNKHCLGTVCIRWCLIH